MGCRSPRRPREVSPQPRSPDHNLTRRETPINHCAPSPCSTSSPEKANPVRANSRRVPDVPDDQQATLGIGLDFSAVHASRCLRVMLVVHVGAAFVEAGEVGGGGPNGFTTSAPRGRGYPHTERGRFTPGPRRSVTSVARSFRPQREPFTAGVPLIPDHPHSSPRPRDRQRTVRSPSPRTVQSAV
jgi:hypothetical protein